LVDSRGIQLVEKLAAVWVEKKACWKVAKKVDEMVEQTVGLMETSLVADSAEKSV
jgi:hypothetical protein